MPLAPGTRLGPYEVVAPIGAGGMGEVYRARDKRLDRDVAIKVLPEALARDPERRERFEREAKAVAALSHPQILAIFDFGEHDGVFYAAMELLEGQTLRDRLAAAPDAALPVRKAIDLAIQIARGLAAAHDRGIVHRDLKPENLFLVGDGQLKILDFGLAKAVDSGATPEATPTRIAATEPGTVMGTVGYMAPEQVRGQPVDARADLFSLGVVLYEMVTGHRPFQGATAADTMSAILREDPPELTGTRADLSQALDRIIRHCLEKDPRERFQTARDVAFALSSLSAPATSMSGASAAASSERQRRPGLFREGPGGWLVLVAVGVAAAAAGLATGRTLAPAAAEMAFAPRTAAPQAIFAARFMPDGKTLIFSSAPTGSAPSLFESRDDRGAPRAFGPPRTHLLSISKSGELAVLIGARYLGHRLMMGTLARMNVDGAPRAMADDVREADWLPDGSDLAVIRAVGARDQLEFPMGHVVHQADGYLSDPRVSPDGTRVAFMEHPARFDNRGWVKVVDRTGTVTTTAGEFSGEEGVAWSPDGRSVRFAGVDGAQYRIFSVPATGGTTPISLLTSAGNLYIQDVAPDGRMAVTREDARYGVVARGAGQDTERDLTPLDQAWGPSLSRDGRVVLFTDGRGGHDYAVVLSNVDGSPPVRLGDGDAIAFSPDERWATARLLSSGKCVVYPTGAGAMIPIPMGLLERCAAASFFPDGKSLLVMGNEPGKRMRAYRATFPGGTPEALLPEGILPVRVLANGRSILVRDGAIWRRAEIGAPWTEVPALRPDDAIVDWSPDERSALVRNGQGQMDQVQLDTGQRTKLGDLAPADRAGLMTFAPNAYRDNGRQYVYSYQRRVSTLYLVTTAR